MTAFYIATAALWIVAIALVRQHLIDAGMHPRRGEGCGQRARQDRGEGGEFRTIHNLGDTHVR